MPHSKNSNDNVGQSQERKRNDWSDGFVRPLLLFTLETVTISRQLRSRPCKVNVEKYEQQLILDHSALPKFEGITKKERNPNKAGADVKKASLPLHSSAGSCLNRPQLCLCRHGERPAQRTDRMLAGRYSRILWNVPALRTSVNTVTDLFMRGSYLKLHESHPCEGVHASFKMRWKCKQSISVCEHYSEDEQTEKQPMRRSSGSSPLRTLLKFHVRPRAWANSSPVVGKRPVRLFNLAQHAY